LFAQPFEGGGVKMTNQTNQETKNSDFTPLKNKLLQDKNLSFEATGLLILMLSSPNDQPFEKGWILRQKKLIGRVKLNRIIKELTDNLYLIIQKKRDKNSKFLLTKWILNDRLENISKIQIIQGISPQKKGVL
jgi:hypothetical protein